MLWSPCIRLTFSLCDNFQCRCYHRLHHDHKWWGHNLSPNEHIASEHVTKEDLRFTYSVGPNLVSFLPPLRMSRVYSVTLRQTSARRINLLGLYSIALWNSSTSHIYFHNVRAQQNCLWTFILRKLSASTRQISHILSVSRSLGLINISYMDCLWHPACPKPCTLTISLSIHSESPNDCQHPEKY